jgi:hypothetical protein
LILFPSSTMADNVNQTRAGGNASGVRANQSRAALDPRAPVLVQPFKRLVEEGLITELSVVFTPMGVTVKGKASKAMCDVEGSGLNQTDFFPVGKLAAVADKGKLAPPPSKKKKGAAAPAEASRPSKSLCKEDFAGNPQQLQQRANAVAQAAGGSSLVGRVRSAGHFTGTETVSYQTWWETATAEQRAHSLCQGRHLAGLTEEEKAKLTALRCPFRGTAEFTVRAQEEEEESEEEDAAAPS